MVVWFLELPFAFCSDRDPVRPAGTHTRLAGWDGIYSLRRLVLLRGRGGGGCLVPCLQHQSNRVLVPCLCQLSRVIAYFFPFFFYWNICIHRMYDWPAFDSVSRRGCINCPTNLRIGPVFISRGIDSGQASCSSIAAYFVAFYIRRVMDASIS
jgi:hypothetical protein